MKLILYITISSLLVLTAFASSAIEEGEVSHTLTHKKDVIEIFTEQGDCKLLSTTFSDLEKEFTKRGGSLESIRKIDLKTGKMTKDSLNLCKVVKEKKVALVSSTGTTRSTIAWHILKNAGYSNLWAPNGIKNGIDTLMPLSDELEQKAKSAEIENLDFEDVKKYIAMESGEYESVFKEKTPIFIDQYGFSYDRISRLGENWTEEFDPSLIVDGEINKEVILHKKILRERFEHEYYIPIIQNKNVVIALSNDAYYGVILRLTEVAIKYNLSLEGVKVIPIIVDEIENTFDRNIQVEHYIDSLRELIGLPPLYYIPKN